MFNDPIDPRRDTTAAIGPAADLWLKAGPARLSGKVSGQYLYFDQYENQRAFNTGNRLKLAFPTARITPFLAGEYENSKNRSGYEIDSRARMVVDSVAVGADVRLSAKSSLRLSGGRSRTKFDDQETFLGVDLGRALNRATNIEQVELRHQLSALTTLVVDTQALQDRFDLEPLRDSNSIRVLPGFELKPSALISGRVLVGYRRFDALRENVPSYQGVIASVDAKFVNGSRQFGVRVARDLAYSFEPTEPYYALTDVGVTVIQRLTYSWEVVGRAGRQVLDYQQLESLSTDGRVDKGHEYGLGIGYRIGRILRLGLDVNYYQRHSPTVGRDYEGYRFGASVSYGLPQ